MTANMRHLGKVVIFLLVYAAAANADSFAVGETVKLRATHHDGVPLHGHIGPTKDFDRVLDGSTVVLLKKDSGSDHWFEVRAEDDREGWLHSKYFERVDLPRAEANLEQEEAIWSSGEECLAAYEAGARMAKNDKDAIRLATWNIRWFPRGCSPGQSCSENATDLKWLACTIAWMQPDVLALQEILDNPDDRFSFAVVVEELEKLTDSTWASPDLNRCGAAGGQHVGLLWNQDRVSLSSLEDEEQLNGSFARFGGGACAGNIRPGRYAYVKSETAGGVDFHVASVHFDSGIGDKDYQNRLVSRYVSRLQ